MRLPFHTLDVFTQTQFGGNPLAVVLGADALEPARMQQVAREFNLSETVFVLSPRNPGHTARVRIFTPQGELPFAGHPTVGTAILLAQQRLGPSGGTGSSIIVLEEEIGIVRIGVRLAPEAPAFAEFDAPRLPEDLGAAPAYEDIASAVGLIPSEVGFENHRPSRFSAGVPFPMIPVRSLEAIRRARPVAGSWERAFPVDGAAYFYCRETERAPAAFHARMFAPGHGIAEDPATGAAAAAFAGVVARFDAPPAGEHRYLIEQGFEMGRPSHIHLSLGIEGGRLGSVRIGGHGVRVTDGEIET